MDRLEGMALLVAAADAGSLSAAARRLGTPLATVSRKVAELEAHLGTRLLTRGSRRLALTEAGRGYVEAARRILEQVEEAERAAGGEYAAPRGALAVTAPIAFGRLHVLPVVLDFLKAYAEIDVRLSLSDRVVHLQEDHIDVAVRIGDLADSRLVATRVGAIRPVLCASPAYLAARGTPRHPRDLAEHDAVAFEGLAAGAGWALAEGQGVPARRARLSVTTADAAVDAAVAGLGVTRVLSYQAAAALASGALVAILRDFEPAPWPVHLIHAGQGPLPQKLRAFLDFSAPRLRTALAAQAA
jgi:DNA-binding transcriptional LysR family regulator